MFKSLFAAAAALSMSAGAAVAGPYVNVETNASWNLEMTMWALLQIFTLDLKEK